MVSFGSVANALIVAKSGSIPVTARHEIPSTSANTSRRARSFAGPTAPRDLVGGHRSASRTLRLPAAATAASNSLSSHVGWHSSRSAFGRFVGIALDVETGRRVLTLVMSSLFAISLSCPCCSVVTEIVVSFVMVGQLRSNVQCLLKLPGEHRRSSQERTFSIPVVYRRRCASTSTSRADSARLQSPYRRR